MTSFVTQCPHCRTSFRVSRTQLAAAHGVVRCGACMELFNAARHLQGGDANDGNTADTATAGSPLVTAPAQARTQPQTTPAVEDSTLWIHDDLDLDNLDLDEELAKLERQELELSREFLELEPQSRESLQSRLDDQPTEADEVWAEQLLRAESDTPDSDPHTEAEPSFTTESSSGTAELHFTPVNAEHPAPPSPLTNPPGPLAKGLNPEDRVEPVFDSVIETDDEPPHTSLPESSDDEDQRTVDRSSRRDEDPLFELDDEPLQLDWQARRRPWGRWLGWGLLNLIALFALAAQYVAYNFDEVARQDEYRPWLEKICPALGCELPPRVDISQIKSSNLVVRSHPDFAGALVVDAIIYNRASFPQPFPLLEIRFDDINGQTQARRIFKPGEYLSGELAGQRQMPSQIPIHIALDILDPGAKAVNYSLSFRSPE